MEDKMFGKVQWDNEDLRNALDLQGYPQTEKNISLLRQVCEKSGFVEAQIAAGWDHIYTQIYQLRNKLSSEEAESDDSKS